MLSHNICQNYSTSRVIWKRYHYHLKAMNAWILCSPSFWPYQHHVIMHTFSLQLSASYSQCCVYARQQHVWGLLSATTVFHCWPLSCSTGAKGRFVRLDQGHLSSTWGTRGCIYFLLSNPCGPETQICYSQITSPAVWCNAMLKSHSTSYFI